MNHQDGGQDDENRESEAHGDGIASISARHLIEGTVTGLP